MTTPATILPKAARDRLKTEVGVINRVYKSAIDRREALNHAIAKLKQEYPNAFVPEPENGITS